jgi:hypothetical protein
MSLVTIKNKSGRQWPPQSVKPSDRVLFAFIAALFEYQVFRDPNLDLVAFFEGQRFYYSCGQAHHQAVTPLRYSHRGSLDIHDHCILFSRSLGMVGYSYQE